MVYRYGTLPCKIHGARRRTDELGRIEGLLGRKSLGRARTSSDEARTDEARTIPSPSELRPSELVRAGVTPSVRARPSVSERGPKKLALRITPYIQDRPHWYQCAYLKVWWFRLQKTKKNTGTGTAGGRARRWLPLQRGKNKNNKLFVTRALINFGIFSPQP